MDGYFRALARQGRRPKTIETYSPLLIDFGEWLLKDRIEGMRSITPTEIELWQDSVHGWAAPRTQRVAATVVRGILRWAANQGDAPESLWLRVASPKSVPSQPRPLTDSELALILRSLDPVYPAELPRMRVRALFLVLFSSGARISEALQLRRDSFHERAAEVIQKGGSPHTLLISDRAESALGDYLERRLDESPALFYNRLRGRPLNARDAQLGWDDLCKQLGIRRFTSHRIRHTTATTMLAQGIDWLVIARHLGHRSLQAIQGYAAVAMKSRQAAVEAIDRKQAS